MNRVIVRRVLASSAHAWRFTATPVGASVTSFAATTDVVLSPCALLECARTSSCTGCVGSQYGGSMDASKTDAAAAASERKVTHYSKLGMDGFTDIKYNTAADALLENVETIVDALDNKEVEDINCNGGVLTIETANRGTYILNKQAPNVQLWLSSPLSGPHHYDMVIKEGDAGSESVFWLSDNDGHDLKKKLEKELSEVFGVSLQL